MSIAAAAVGRQAWRKLARNNSTAAIRRTISLLPKSQQFRPTSSVPAFTANASKAAPRVSQSQQYRSYSSGGSSGDGTKVKFWPFVLVLAAGTGGWVLLINRQKSKFTFSLGTTNGRTAEMDDVVGRIGEGVGAAWRVPKNRRELCSCRFVGGAIELCHVRCVAMPGFKAGSTLQERHFLNLQRYMSLETRPSTVLISTSQYYIPI